MSGHEFEAESVRFGFVLGLTLPRLFERHGEWAAEAERAGASLLSIGEHPVLSSDPYLLLQSMASHTTTPKVGTCVSMPGLRHPAVHARTMVTLQELTGGRAFFGLGRGLGGLQLLGERSAKTADMFEYGRVVRALCAGEKAVYAGKELQLIYEPRPVPLFVAAFGERGLELAGRYADGIIVGNGATVDRVERARRLAGEGAAAEGRSLDDLEMWYMIRIHVSTSEAQARREMEFYLSRLMISEFGNEQALKGLDPDLVDRIKKYTSQAGQLGSVDSYGFDCDDSRELLDRYDLTTWGARQFFLLGTVDDIVRQLRGLVDAGARNFIVPQMLPDIIKTTREAGEVFASLATAQLEAVVD